MQQLQSIKRVLDSLARVADLLVLPGSVDSAVQVLCVLPLKVSKLLLLLGCLLLEVWYLKVDIPHQKLAGFSKKDVCSSAQRNVSHVRCVCGFKRPLQEIYCSLARCQDPDNICQPCQVCPETEVSVNNTPRGRHNRRALLSFSYARKTLSHRPAVPVRFPKNVFSAVFAIVSRMALTAAYSTASPSGRDSSGGRFLDSSAAFALIAWSFLCQSLESFCLLICKYKY